MLDGRLLNERYKVKQTIGGGGMANVYLGRDIILDRDVAIKVLRLEYANDEEFIARFHREAHSATSLSHPNIVNIYDVGEEDDIYYMVMEYVDGMTLKKYIQTNGPVEVLQSMDIMKQITSAISHAHANDIIHRDIKPQNILIDPYGKVKVTDFGIAIALSATSLTQTNSVLGSVHYLSPEQARGGMANKKSDIYSLGIVLFELLTGRLPFSGQSAVSIALKHLQSETPSLRRWIPDLPQSVENIVLKATTKDPFHRYDTVYEMEDDLESALDPDRVNEAKFAPPEDDGEETKAIPVITDANFKSKGIEDTIIHDTKGEAAAVNKEGRKRKRSKAWVWIPLLLFLLGGAAFAIFLLPGLLPPDDVQVIDVAGMEYEEALSELSALNLVVERETMHSNEVPEGHVIRTDPEASQTVKEGSTVTVFSSLGKEKVTFPNYEGREFEQIESLLRDQGYKDVIEYPKYSDQPEGEIITQIQPQPDSKVIPEETNVIFEISRGPQTVSLRSLVEMTEEAAREYLTSNGLRVSVVKEHSEDIPAGTVISQQPEAYTEVELDSEVEITVSTGPVEKPPLLHTVSFTVPYTGNQGTEQSDTVVEEEQSEGNQEEIQKENDEETDAENSDPPPQTVRIYVGDMNNDITVLYKEETITEDQEFTVTLMIPPGEEAEYQVMRDDKIFTEKTVPYEEEEEGE